MHITKMRLTRVTRNLSKILDLKSMKILDNYAQFNPSPLTMQQMLEFGQTATELESYQFLKREVPVRLSNIMKEVNLLPSSLLQMPSIILLQVHKLSRILAFNCRNNSLYFPRYNLSYSQKIFKVIKRHMLSRNGMHKAFRIFANTKSIMAIKKL